MYQCRITSSLCLTSESCWSVCCEDLCVWVALLFYISVKVSPDWAVIVVKVEFRSIVSSGFRVDMHLLQCRNCAPLPEHLNRLDRKVTARLAQCHRIKMLPVAKVLLF